MVIKIPAYFNVNAVELDPFETYIRDTLNLTVENWAKFRHTINIGNNAGNLESHKGVISESVKEAYRELAKSHYEIIKSLGCAKLSLEMARQFQTKNLLVYEKSQSDFYFHLGRLLDNLARLIFIINDPQCATKSNKKGNLLRHWIDWGTLNDYLGYTRLKRSKQLRGITNIRNVLTHGWSVPKGVRGINAVLCWPLAIRSKRDFYWFYDEAGKAKISYRKWIDVLRMMDQDFGFIQIFQNAVFAKLTKDVLKFEKHHSLVIQ